MAVISVFIPILILYSSLCDHLGGERTRNEVSEDTNET